MYHAIGALLILIGLIVLIKYIMRTGETEKVVPLKPIIIILPTKNKLMMTKLQKPMILK